MKITFGKLARICLLLVYLVIVAGAVVRMTGSGMGCPDWPKCFGYYIPPTQESDIEWQPGREYKNGQVIIWNESLLVATGNFTTDSVYRPENWSPYTRHNYAVFNPYHTWTEFINRLIGALAGLGTLILAIYALRFRKTRPVVTILSFVVVLAMGFQAWLGATVVYSVLEPVKITLHMLMALGIVALLLYLIHKSSDGKREKVSDKTTAYLLLAALALTVIQVALGTQVRQYVDTQVDTLGDQARGQWLEGVGWQFYIHRSLSILVVLMNGYLAYRVYKLKLGYKKINWVLAVVLAGALTGTLMYYLGFPVGTQPVHLVLAALLFGFQFYLVLEAFNASRQYNSL